MTSHDAPAAHIHIKLAEDVRPDDTLVLPGGKLFTVGTLTALGPRACIAWAPTGNSSVVLRYGEEVEVRS